MSRWQAKLSRYEQQPECGSVNMKINSGDRIVVCDGSWGGARLAIAKRAA
jgi:hypothetical protein